MAAQALQKPDETLGMGGASRTSKSTLMGGRDSHR